SLQWRPIAPVWPPPPMRSSRGWWLNNARRSSWRNSSTTMSRISRRSMRTHCGSFADATSKRLRGHEENSTCLEPFLPLTVHHREAAIDVAHAVSDLAERIYYDYATYTMRSRL